MVRDLIDAFCMCLGMFTAIPMFYRPWEERLRPVMTACLPFVGLLTGVLWLLIAWIVRKTGMHPALGGAIIAALPAFITGAIHIDGYMDTSDAVFSWRSREKRLEILKDPHVGSFAVISLAALALFMYGASVSLLAFDRPLFPLLLIPVVSRCCSAFCVSRLKSLNHSEYAQQDSAVSAVYYIIIVAVALLLSIFSGWRGILVIHGLVGSYALAMRKSYRLLDGCSGDLAGYALCISECAGLIILAI